MTEIQGTIGLVQLKKLQFIIKENKKDSIHLKKIYLRNLLEDN